MNHIETNRFILRKLRVEDAESVFEILRDPETRKYLNIPAIEKLQDSTNLINEYLKGNEEDVKFPFAIVSKDNDAFIGVFLLKVDLFDKDCFEYTVYIMKKYWNIGVYSEIFPKMVSYAFEKIKTGNVRGFVMKSNTASARVLLKNEFILEKTFKVPGIEEMIESYLMTKDYYYKYYKSKRIV